MATIQYLRPTKVSDYNGTIKTTPSGTPQEDWHKLVNEEVSDENSTEVGTYTEGNSYLTFDYDFENLSDVTHCMATFVFSLGAAVTPTFYYTIQIVDKLDNVIVSKESSFAAPNYTNNKFYEIQTSVDDFMVINNLASGTIRIKILCNSNSTSKQPLISYTQTYLTIEQDKSLAFYEKQNGEWVKIWVNAYIKKQNAWYRVDNLTQLLSESKYRVEVMD